MAECYWLLYFPCSNSALIFAKPQPQAHRGFSFAEREKFLCSGYIKVLSVAGFKNRECAM
jgi:hypothetical protein